MSPRPTIEYQPALDGVRALAVVAVLLFHADVPGFGGGYLGVSVFFTLSGYLITSLLLHEHGRTGSIDLAGFYARRLRRLVPASAVALLAVAMLAATTDLFDGVTALRAHLVGSLAQVTNWVFLAGDGSYQGLLARSAGTSSPLEHFWSLAIEEQFYWFWPPTMLLLLTRVPRRRGRLTMVGVATVVAAIGAPVIAHVWGPDAAYWSTPARIGEILVGAFLAVLLSDLPVPSGTGRFAVPALGALAVAVVLFPSAGGPAYEGALPLVAVVSGALILGLQSPGPVRRLCEWGTLVWVGRISYGLYVFHWPVFLLIHPDRMGWPTPVLLAVRLLVTLALSVGSYRFLERPIRNARLARPRFTFAAAALSTAALVAVATVAVPHRLGEYWGVDPAVAQAAAIEVSDRPLVTAVVTTEPSAATADTGPSAPTGSTAPLSLPTRRLATAPTPDVPRPLPTDAAAPAASAPSPTVSPTVSPTTVEPTTGAPSTVPFLPALERPVRIVVAGDSTARAFGTGLVTWAAAHPDLAQVEVVAAPGCGFLLGGERRTGDTIAPIEGCDGWTDRFLVPAVDRLQPDVVMLLATSWDIVDRRWDSGDLITPFDAEFAERLGTDYRGVVADLEAAGATHVALVRHPIPDPYWLAAADAQEDPARHEVLYGVHASIADADARVAVVALDHWMTQAAFDRDESVRPDGIHPTPEAAADVAERFLGEQLVRIALDLTRP